jgi:hypothetical protein
MSKKTTGLDMFWMKVFLLLRVSVWCRKVKALSKTKKERYFPLFVVSLSSSAWIDFGSFVSLYILLSALLHGTAHSPHVSLRFQFLLVRNRGECWVLETLFHHRYCAYDEKHYDEFNLMITKD